MVILLIITLSIVFTSIAIVINSDRSGLVESDATVQLHQNGYKIEAIIVNNENVNILELRGDGEITNSKEFKNGEIKSKAISEELTHGDSVHVVATVIEDYDEDVIVSTIYKDVCKE